MNGDFSAFQHGNDFDIDEVARCLNRFVYRHGLAPPAWASR